MKVQSLAPRWAPENFYSSCPCSGNSDKNSKMVDEPEIGSLTNKLPGSSVLKPSVGRVDELNIQITNDNFA